MENTYSAALAKMVTMTGEQLEAVASVTEQLFYQGYLPLVGRYLTHGYIDDTGSRRLHKTAVEFYSHLLDDNDTGIKIVLTRYVDGPESGRCYRLQIGHRVAGPMLSYEPDRGWCNLYGHQNHNKDYACGGNWSSDHRQVYPTMREALIGRDYVCRGITMTTAKYATTQDVYDLLWAIGN